MAKVAGGRSKVRRPSRSSGPSKGEFVVCIDPEGHHDLQARRIYQVLSDASAARSAFLRIIDDSGEDYFYPASCFVAIDLPQAVSDALQQALPLRSIREEVARDGARKRVSWPLIKTSHKQSRPLTNAELEEILAADDVERVKRRS